MLMLLEWVMTAAVEWVLSVEHMASLMLRSCSEDAGGGIKGADGSGNDHGEGDCSLGSHGWRHTKHTGKERIFYFVFGSHPAELGSYFWLCA